MPRPPDPNALRRDRKDDPAWTRLTARPDDAVVPDFPLTQPTDRELALWSIEWSRPHANEWERAGEQQAVALFVRLLARAEQPDAPVTLMRPLMQIRDELGISATGARRRRWLMPDVTTAGRPSTVTPLRPVEPTRRPSTRDRFARTPSTDRSPTA